MYLLMVSPVTETLNEETTDVSILGLVSIKNTSAWRLPGIPPPAPSRQGIRPLSVIPVLDKGMNVCQSRGGAEIL